jgi:putative ABC transport system ATP-binding protein
MARVLDPQLQQLATSAPPHIEREVTAANVTIQDDSGALLLDSVTAKLTPGEAVAAIGPVGAGGEYLAEAMARLLEPSAGRILVDGVPIDTLPDSMVGRRVGYADANTYLPQSTLRDSLIYGLRHAPLSTHAKEAREEKLRQHEALAAGNTGFDVNDDWIDYQSAGAAGPEDLLLRLREVLAVVDLENDVYRLGLRGRLPPEPSDDLQGKILAGARGFPRTPDPEPGRALRRDVRPAPLYGKRFGDGKPGIRRRHT